MRKILVACISVLVLTIIMSACNFEKTVEESDFSEASTFSDVSEQSSTTIIDSSSTFEDVNEFVLELNLMEPYEWDINSRENNILLTDSGYYYYVEKGDNDGPHRILVYDTGDEEYAEQNNADGFTVSYMCDNIIYGYQTGVGICKYENGVMSALNNLTCDTYETISYYTKDHIYFYLNDDEMSVIYRMDFDGNNLETVVVLDNEYDIYDFSVYDEKIWYEYINRKSSEKTGDYSHKFAVYDLSTNQNSMLDNGGIGLINNDYMYYIDSQKHLSRFNLSDYSCETVCDSEVSAFDFNEGYILYSCDESVYRFNGTENTLIFSADKFFNTDYYYEISAIQCQNNHIFIEVTSGAYYTYLAEIDIDGTMLKKIHEDEIW